MTNTTQPQKAPNTMRKPEQIGTPRTDSIADAIARAVAMNAASFHTTPLDQITKATNTMITTKSTRYPQDAEGSPQILVKLRKMNGEEDRTIVVPGKDGKSFRIVLDDVCHETREGETLEQAVRRQQAAWTRKVWADMPEYWIDDSTTKPSFNGVSSRDGVLFRNDTVLNCIEADALANSVGFLNAEQLVEHLDPKSIRRNADLIHFAKRVLSILESSQDWNADTTEAISTAAINANVAHARDGFFHANKER